MEGALLLGSMELLAMELLQAAVLFDSFLQISLVLGRDVLNLLVEPFNLELAHHVLLSELFKGS